MLAVTVKNICIGTGMPKICVPVTGTDEQQILAQLDALQKTPADLAEWRADYCRDIHDPEKTVRLLRQIQERTPDLPVLFTARTEAEGGLFRLPPERYAQNLEQVICSSAADMIDIELSSPASAHLLSLAQAHHVKTVISFHDFRKTPAEDRLLELFSQMEQTGADILKIAVMPHNESDAETMIRAVQKMHGKTDRPLIGISMGEYGIRTRTECERIGSAITFASAGQASAPGQMDVFRLHEILRELHQ